MQDGWTDGMTDIQSYEKDLDTEDTYTRIFFNPIKKGFELSSGHHTVMGAQLS